MAQVLSIDGNTISYGGFLLRELGNGSLTITKTVSGSGFDPTKTFEIVATFSAPVTYNGTTATTHTFNLADGDSVTITNIPELTEYAVTETPLSQQDIADGYSFIGITNGEGSIRNGQTLVATAENYHSPFPAKTIRIQFENENYTPTSAQWQSTVSWTRVSTSPNIWDCENTNSVWKPGNFGTTWGAFGGSKFQVLSMNAEGVTSTQYMFYYSGLTSIKDVSGTEGVTDMHYAFEGCRNLTSVELFNTSHVTTMEHMFGHCSSLTSVPLFDTGSVTNMEHMFGGCTSLTSVPLFNTSHVTNMKLMFWECTSLTSVPLFNTSNVTDMKQMFYECTSLTSVPLFNTGKVTDMSLMFSGCTALTAVPLFNTARVVDVDSMFYNCVAVSSGAYNLYSRMSRQSNPPSSHGQCFDECGRNTAAGRADLARIPITWGGDLA